MFDNMLQAYIIKLVDISYGGENSFNKAIESAVESLARKYFDDISQVCSPAGCPVGSFKRFLVVLTTLWQNSAAGCPLVPIILTLHICTG